MQATPKRKTPATKVRCRQRVSSHYVTSCAQAKTPAKAKSVTKAIKPKTTSTKKVRCMTDRGSDTTCMYTGCAKEEGGSGQEACKEG